MPKPDERIKELEKELSGYQKYQDIIDAFVLRIIKDKVVLTSYPSLSVSLFDPDSHIPESQSYPRAFVVDYVFTWWAPFKEDYSSLFSIASAVEQGDSHLNSLHLYLFFSSNKPHVPSTMGHWEFQESSDIEEMLSQVREFTFSLDDVVSSHRFLGFRLYFDQGK